MYEGRMVETNRPQAGIKPCLWRTTWFQLRLPKTMQQQLRVELTPMQRRLPWIVMVAALVIYVITLNHSATFSGVINLAKAVGWDWRPSIASPLQYLLTFPIRWLPSNLQLLGLNLLSAACAAPTLGLLARCVCLLPH